MRIEYAIELWHQVLYEGTWEDGVWDWEVNSTEYDDEETARQMFEKAKVESDAEVIRLYKVYRDKFGCQADRTLLDSTDF
jgi:hypothetical protein